VVKGLQAKWGTCSRTVAYNRHLYSLACWNNLIAAGVGSGDIILLDAITGIQTSILPGHADWVRSVVFSSDGKFLISGSDDKTVNLWDVQTGGIIKTFHGHTSDIYSVSISMDHTMVASGSRGRTIRLWDTQTGECCYIIDKFSGEVSSVKFSPTNPQLLISGSSDHTVQQWNTDGQQVGPTHKGTGAAFSPDGTCFVLWGGVVAKIQNSNSGAVITTIRAPDGYLQCCCFSPNGKFIAGASGTTAYVWDITGSCPCLIETYIGHTSTIISLTFSSFLISSDDKSIKFWQIGAPSTAQAATNPDLAPPTSTPIIFVSLYAKDSIAISSDRAGVVRAWDILTGLCKALFYTTAGPLNQRDILVVENRLIITWYTPGIWDWDSDSPCTWGKLTIHTWDAKKGEHSHAVDISSNSPIIAVRISGDGSKVFLLNQDCIQALSTQTGEVVGEVKVLGLLGNVPLIVDGSRAWVQTRDLQTGWDFGTPGSTPIPSPDMPPDPIRPHLEFIDGAKQQNTSLSRIEDTVTGEVVYWLPERYGGFTVAEWDGQYLVTGYNSGEVMILDFGHMALR